MWRGSWARLFGAADGLRRRSRPILASRRARAVARIEAELQLQIAKRVLDLVHDLGRPLVEGSTGEHPQPPAQKIEGALRIVGGSAPPLANGRRSRPPTALSTTAPCAATLR